MIPGRSTFESAYAGQAPWDIGKPQKPFLDVADQITGSVLDAGCGTGETALYFTGRGCRVTGIDFLEEAIRRAQGKAAERGVQVTFLIKDALTLKDWPERFDNVIDSGLFHVFGDEERRPYVEGLATGLKPGGRLFLLCFSNEEPGTQGPRRVSKKELHAAFAQGYCPPQASPVAHDHFGRDCDLHAEPGERGLRCRRPADDLDERTDRAVWSAWPGGSGHPGRAASS
jgi:cyclopropane fatty-acyl-phospholipid synthase-like methyltransferase